MGLSINAFAKLVGVTEAVVRKGIKSGRVVLSADGTLDPKTQVARWNDTRDPSKIRAHNPPSPPAEVVQLPGTRRQPKPPMTASTPEASAKAGAKFDQLKTAKLAVDLQIAQEELRKIRSETVNRDETRRALTSFARLIRDKWVNFANRYGQQIASDIGADPKATMASLDRYVRLQLDEIANAKPTLPE